MSDEDLRTEVDGLQAENAAPKAKAEKGIPRKAPEKGGVSVYGLGRFPITLHREQWVKPLGLGAEIRADWVQAA